MSELENGKLYIVYSSLRHEEDVLSSPFSTFVFATKDPYADVEDNGITIVNGTMVVYLGKLIVPSMRFKMHPIFEQTEYCKLLVEDEILYVLNDGYTSFQRVNNDSRIS